MKSLRRTILAMLILLLIGAAGAGAYVWVLWSRSEELLSEAVRDELAEIAPEWHIVFRRASLDLQGQAHLYDVTALDDGRSGPILEVAEIVLAVDREALAEKRMAIQNVRLVQPRLKLVRGIDGAWNLSQLPPIRGLYNNTPEFRWEQGVVTLTLAASNPDSARSLRFENVNVHMLPSGKRQFLIRASGVAPIADELTIEGNWTIDDGSWSAQGAVRNLKIDRRLLELVALSLPDSKDALHRLDAAIAGLGGDQRRGTAPPTELSASADVQFAIARRQPDSPLESQAALQVLHGQLENAALPYPLRELRGQATFRGGQVDVPEFWAQTGTTQLKLERGTIRNEAGLHPAEFDMSIAGLPIDDRLYRMLPADDQRLFAMVQPTGRIDARLHVEFDGRKRWKHGGEVLLRDCTAAHVKFPYRVERINGTIQRTGNLVSLDLNGQAASRRIKLRGRVADPGPTAQTRFVIDAAGLPIDEDFRTACPPAFRATIDRLALRGEIDGRLVLSRAAGPDNPVVPAIKGRLRNGALRFNGFPYPLSDVTGLFSGNLEDWEFKSFRGSHGSTDLAWSGDFLPEETGERRLKLRFQARNTACDRDLFAALPPEWQEVWGELNPQGVLDADGELTWQAGGVPAPPRIALDATFRDGKLTVRSFPLPFDDVQADVGFDNGEVTIRSLSARRDDMRVRASGSIDFPDRGEWHLRLADMHVDDLQPDGPFRRALPAKLKSLIASFNPQGKLSIAGMLDFRGKKGDEYSVTAAWDTTTVYTGNTLTAGIELKDMHGTARFQGTWDGEVVSSRGWIDLDLVKVFDYQLTAVSGPISIDGSQLVVGSKDAAGARGGTVVDNTRRLTAKFIDGQIGLDAVVHLAQPGDLPSYRARLTLTDGELKRFAQSYLPRHGKLDGVMNGWVDLQGEGTDPRRLTGSGKLAIAPAKLYEVPLIVAIIRTAALTPTQEAAFNEAMFNFHIENRRVRFDRIDLVGDALHLYGIGNVQFDQSVNFEFLASTGRRQWPIPIVTEVFKLATSGLVGVKVTGTVAEPVAVVRPLPQIDDALKKIIIGIFEPQGRARR
jgi:hypothetical protein